MMKRHLLKSIKEHKKSPKAEPTGIVFINVETAEKLVQTLVHFWVLSSLLNWRCWVVLELYLTNGT